MRIKVESESLEEFKVRKEHLRSIKRLVITIFLILQVPIVGVQYYRKLMSDGQLNDKILIIFDLFEIVLRTVKIPLDLYIFYLYMRLINYFVTMKKLRLEANLMKMTFKNKFIIAFAFILGILGLYAIII